MHKNISPPFSRTNLVALLSTFIFLASLPPSRAETLPDYEPNASFPAQKIVPGEILQEQDFKINDQVESDGFMYNFLIDTEYGQFDAYSIAQLHIRLQEIRAIKIIDNTESSDIVVERTSEFIEGTIESTVNVVTNPVGTAKELPGGVKRLFKKTVRKGKDLAYSTKKFKDDMVKKDENGEDQDKENANGDAEKGNDPDSKGQLVYKKAGSLAKSYLGVSASQRKWARRLGVTPYSSNAVLRKKLKRVAWTDTAAGFATGLVATPSALGYIRLANKLAWEMDASELRVLNEKRLKEMGIKKKMIEEFLNSPWYSPARQTIAVSALYSMSGVRNRAMALTRLHEVDSEESAMFSLLAIEMLAAYHESIAPLRELSPMELKYTAITDNNKLIMLIPVDYLSWNEAIAINLDEINQNSAAIKNLTNRELWVTGNCSPVLQTVLLKNRIDLVENALLHLGDLSILKAEYFGVDSNSRF